MHEVKWRDSLTLKPFKLMEATLSKHKRSNSDPVKSKFEKHEADNIFGASNHLKLKMGQRDGPAEGKKGQPPYMGAQDSLKQEILELQNQLQAQFMVRSALEKALSYRTVSHDIMNDKTIPKPAKELINEVAVLELEVVYLEKYLLSVYRKMFDQQVSMISSTDAGLKMNSIIHEDKFPVIHEHDLVQHEDNSANQSSLQNDQKESNDIFGLAKLSDSGIQRCHSSLSQHLPGSSRTMRSVARALDSYHSLPLSMLEQAQNDASNVISLADHFGIRANDDATETPNWLSEEMIKSISTIYCELSDPPLVIPDYPSSPTSFSSSPSEFPTQGQGSMWSPSYGKFSSFNSSLDNAFHIGKSKEFSGPYCTMVEVHWISRDDQKLREVQNKLHYFRSLVSRLEEVDPRKMKHEGKLAFWINVHNALVMHACFVYGIPQNNTKRVSLVLKAAYNIGGYSVDVDMIQSQILRCRLPRPGQWLRQLLSSRSKFKVGDARAGYSIDHPEPRLHFALCSGSHSDPAVRVYTPKRVFDDLEAAKEEYIQSTFAVHKDKKLLLPKIVDTFAKDLDLCPSGLLEMIEHLLPASLRKTIQQSKDRKFGKTIDWIQHNFTFRYLLSRELVS
ncbi:hypothetical protein K2173_002209 [Erythroxylum novogranatense]|uniref:Electron transporter n=1 Tax=Erythroxylum novogranatense TaxID=1862640 RepID=A0AAV8T938_9ROSI|nr:hypothetical protein K2173_002209 [Erythroxylum novogranatense]